MYTKILSVDVVVPVHNEADCLQRNILILHNYLKKAADFSWNIIIADNASQDKTGQLAAELSSTYNAIKYFYIPVKGRGYALRKAFLESSADVVCYMDIDLSTNLRYLKLLIEGIACNFDLAVGSRLMHGARVKRSLSREIISRAYNFLVKCLFFNRFSDGQCGFKAIKTAVAKQLVPLVENDNWFFDTELLLLAEYNKFRIFEVPVEWIEDLTSKVKIFATVLDDVAGLLRLRFSIHKKSLIQR
ncbi:MAG: glycosyltransferase [Candidatus Omnitrophota bacterium]